LIRKDFNDDDNGNYVLAYHVLFILFAQSLLFPLVFVRCL